MVVYSTLDELFLDIELSQPPNSVPVPYECCLKYRLIFFCFNYSMIFLKTLYFTSEPSDDEKVM